MPPVDLLQLFLHFLAMSLLAIGGGITTAPEMHRFLVVDKGWMTDTTFTSSIALAQAAPGPNILFVAVLGWNLAGPAGAAVTMAGIMLPSTLLVLAASRWARDNREHIGVRAFSSGMAPLTLGLIIATGWLLAQPYLTAPEHRLATLVLIAITLALMLRTKLSPVWMVLGGGVVGALGWV
ncbi:chromate transporter [Paucibacter sp. JuS9]|uniref:chromate transporter n=1 Tax=Roseateles TaxID=93681 RepID=UPI002FE6873E